MGKSEVVGVKTEQEASKRASLILRRMSSMNLQSEAKNFSEAGRMRPDSLVYHALNALGGLVLCVVAVDASQAGFIVLEGAWTAISLAAFVRTARRGTRTLRCTSSY